VSRGEWQSFHFGVPHQRDWQTGPLGSVDFLVRQQPPGRYLFVRLRFTGGGKATPVVRRVFLEFPRKTSLDLLPPVYRDNPDAEDFSERFLSLFDASIADLDRAIERYRRESFLRAANSDFQALKGDSRAWKHEAQERQLWEQTLSDGLDKK